MGALIVSASERRVAEKRARAPRPPAGRERTANLVDGTLVLGAALLLAVLAPGPGTWSPVVLGFVVAYAVAARVEFEIHVGAAVPTQLVFVPMLFVLPPSTLPLAVAAGLVLSNAPSYLAGTAHPERALAVATSAAYAFGPALVLVAIDGQPLGTGHWPLYVVLLAAQCAVDAAHTALRERIVLGISPRELLRPLGWVYAIDALLSPTGLLLAVGVAEQPVAIVAVLPLVLLLALFGRERRARLDSVLELEVARRANEQLDRLVRSDALTGVANRRAWEEALPAMVANARAAGQPIAVAILDLDHFKRFNDTHGHPAGDALLTDVAACWAARLRPGDLLARMGGEEFAIALPGCDARDARRLAERLRRAMPAGQTCSIGVACWRDGETDLSLVARADRALYDAKADGRDRVVVAPRRGTERLGRRRAVPEPAARSA
jgi:diguanylate cyclase (GGDEF)-like protein